MYMYMYTWIQIVMEMFIIIYFESIRVCVGSQKYDKDQMLFTLVWLLYCFGIPPSINTSF